MYKTKSLKQLIFLALICLSAVLLCFVGVYAAQFNLKYYGNVSPDIYCKIQYFVGDGTPTFNDTNIIFDNHTENETPKNILNTITLKNGTVADKITFRLTNYTTDKHIRLTIKDGSDNNVVQIGCDAATISPSQSQTGSWTVTSVKETTGSSATVSFSVIVEPVHKVTVSGEGLATAGTYYFSELDTTPQIDLIPNVGYQLPKSIQSIGNTCSSFAVKNNSQGKANFSKITADGELTCHCEKVFTIYKNNANSLTSGYHKITDQFLPNNGKYSVRYYNDNVVTKVPKVYKDANGTQVVPETDLATYEGEKYYYYTTGQTNNDIYLPLTDNTTVTTSYKKCYITGSDSIEQIFWKQADNTPVPLDNSASYYHLNRDVANDYDATNELQTGVTYKEYENHTGVNEYYYQASETTFTRIPYEQLYHRYTVTTSGDNFQEYKYYVEMGYYPQSLVDVAVDGESVPSGYVPDGDSYNYTIYNPSTGENETLSLQMYKKTANNVTSYYVWSPIKLNPNSVGLTLNNTKVTSGYGMFQLEPIVWIVVGAKDNATDVLNSLYYKDNMFFTDAACGKPFTGQLELLSAYGLDATGFNASSSKANYTSSNIHTWLSASDSTFASNNVVLNSSSNLTALSDKYLVKTPFNTFQADMENDVATISGTSSLFTLSYGKTGENYTFGEYFNNGVAEINTGATYSVGVTSLSDFAIAHNAENGARPKSSTTSSTITTDLAVTMGWSAGSTNIKNKASCAYWLRTAYEDNSTNAYLINLNGVPVVTNSADPNICVRPFTVLDMSYYHNKDVSNPQTPPDYKFYNTYSPSVTP